MYNNLVSVEVLVNGNSVTEYSKDGRVLIEGRKGSEYSIRLKNNTSSTVLAVPTVDGLSVIDGETGSYNSRGYILPPWQSYEIEGWRINNDQIRKFNFTHKSRTYSKQAGKGIDNLGVIGVAVFKQKSYNVTLMHYQDWNHWPQYNNYYQDRVYYDSHSAGSTKGTSATRGLSSSVGASDTVALASAYVGTGMGRTQHSHVNTSSFERESDTPNEISEIYYYTRKALEQMGIIVRAVQKTPSAFPNGFCKQV